MDSLTECRHRLILRTSDLPFGDALSEWHCQDCPAMWVGGVHPVVAAGGRLCGWVFSGPWPEYRSCRLAADHDGKHNVDKSRYRYAPDEPGAINGYVPEGEYERDDLD